MSKIDVSRGVAAVLVLSLAAMWGSTAQAALYSVQLDQSLYGNLNQNDLPGIGSMACGPCSVTNSLVYLENRYPDVYDNKLVPVQANDLNGDGLVTRYDDMMAVATKLAGVQYMNQGANGTFWDMLIYGKEKYIEEVAPGTTRYAAQSYFTWTNPPVPKPGYVTDNQSPTWRFIYDELTAGEDIEILLSAWSNDWGHYVTVTSLNFDDTNNDGVMQQNENATIDYIDPWTGLPGVSSIWDPGRADGLLNVGYSDGAWMSVAVTESVPEPGTLLLSGLALTALGVVRRRAVACERAGQDVALSC